MQSLGVNSKVNMVKLSDQLQFTVTVSLATHVLTVNSEPAGIIFTIISTDKGSFSIPTPYVNSFEEGNYILDMPETALINDITYYFQKWDDDLTIRQRTVNLTSDLTFKAIYTTEPPISSLPYSVAPSIIGVITTLYGLKE